MSRKPVRRTRDSVAESAAGTASAAGAGMTVRHYCQGIGDCHLLKLPRAGGGDFFMLIDCGIHSSVAGGTETVRKIVADIASVTRKLDVVVVTHEHWDHVSGFLTEAEQFGKFEVGEVWMGWTENPKDPLAQKLDKFKAHALAALQLASGRLSQGGPLSSFLSSVHSGVDSVVGFNFGAKGERVRTARDNAAKLARNGPRYMEPKGPPLSIRDLPNLRIYVLGPPRDEALLALTESAAEMYGFASGDPGWPIARALTNALSDDSALVDGFSAPFDPNVGVKLTPTLDAIDPSDPGNSDEAIERFFYDHYARPASHGRSARKPSATKSPDPNKTDQSWRRIDHDWLAMSADLAMQVDDRTNNTSLALAFEFIDSGRVLLFAADAQIGNWVSWQDLNWQVADKTVSARDLLARTVYYKVGHHGSHNATPKAKGLELMTSKDLSAFIPTNAKDAQNVGWGQMPYQAILDELRRRTDGRVIRADDPWISTAANNPGFSVPSGSIFKLDHGQGLWVELDVR
jgi:beta-lactamase superfamily II metal-dependent hydrolase